MPDNADAATEGALLTAAAAEKRTAAAARIAQARQMRLRTALAAEGVPGVPREGAAHDAARTVLGLAATARPRDLASNTSVVGGGTSFCKPKACR